MAAKTVAPKVECLNPNTGGSMQIDKATYDLFSKAIRQALGVNRQLTFTELAEDISARFKKQKANFKGSVGWYTVTVKHDLQARGIIEVIINKGRKLHRLAKKEG
jgi:hypothetical protein